MVVSLYLYKMRSKGHCTYWLFCSRVIDTVLWSKKHINNSQSRAFFGWRITVWCSQGLFDLFEEKPSLILSGKRLHLSIFMWVQIHSLFGIMSISLMINDICILCTSRDAIRVTWYSRTYLGSWQAKYEKRKSMDLDGWSSFANMIQRNSICFYFWIF